MTKISMLNKLKFQFYYTPEGELDLNSYGTYRQGLTGDEIKDYLRVRANTLKIERLYKKFSDISGCNTGCATPDGKFLMYRWDVLRFANKLFNGKETWFD